MSLFKIPLYLGKAWATAYSYIKGKKIKLSKKVDPLEVYLNNPKDTKSMDLLTEVYIPVK